MGLLKEFREFAVKGNMVDMAVGIIIGGAFGIIVKSVIADLIMPIVGIAGNADFSNMYLPLTSGASEKIEAAIAASDPAVTTLAIDQARELGPILAYGNFITVAINFIILAAAVFIMVKVINTAKKKFEAEQEAAPPAAPAADVVLLTEIRDLLAKN